jgi:hypothetical protein
MANKYQNSSQNKATKNLNQTHRSARQASNQASNLEPNQTSSQNTRLASGLQRSISRLARRIKKAKPKLVLSLAFVVALPLIALGVFFGTGLNQEFGASADPATEVRADNFHIIEDDDGTKQIDFTKHPTVQCPGVTSLNASSNFDIVDNKLKYKQDAPTTPNTASVDRCSISGLTGHSKSSDYTDPEPIVIDGVRTSAIQLIIRQGEGQDKIEEAGNCGVHENTNKIMCMYHSGVAEIVKTPDKIDLKPFKDGTVEVFLRLPRPGGSKTDVNDFEELRIMKFEVYIEPVPGCRSPFASNYNGNAIPPKEGEEDVTCEIPLNINHIKLEE